MEVKRKESNVMTPVELFLSVVGVLANALAPTAILMSVGFLLLLLWNRLMPLVVTASLGAGQIGRAGVRRVLSMLCTTGRARLRRRRFGDGQAPGRGGKGRFNDADQN
jgi:hypothetical protein